MQIATNTQTYLKIPKVSPFQISFLHPLTNVSITKPLAPGVEFNFVKIEGWIAEIIKDLRNLNYPDLDLNIIKIN